MFFPILVLPIVRVTCDWLKNGYVVILLPTCPFLYSSISCKKSKKLSTSPRLLVDQKILESNLLKYYTDRMTTMSSKFSFFDKRKLCKNNKTHHGLRSHSSSTCPTIWLVEAYYPEYLRKQNEWPLSFRLLAAKTNDEILQKLRTFYHFLEKYEFS